MMQHMLTTVDNPFDPFTEFDAWDTWDRQAGYGSCAYLSRVVVSSDELCEADQMDDIERGIDGIVKYDPLDVFIKVSKNIEIETQLSKLVDVPEDSVTT